MKLKKLKTLQKIKLLKNIHQFNFIRSNKDEDDFNKYIDLRELGIDIRNGLLTLDEAKQLQRDMKNKINELKNYAGKSDRTKNIKNKVLENVTKEYLTKE